MCGILGGNHTGWDYEGGLNSINHRGPDAQRICNFHNITFAFARLSIMDLSDKGMQPMTKDSVSIIYNGEIYGYEELKKNLERKYSFQSDSDTEVILNAYLEYGDSFIDKIDGMFAIAIYDQRVRRLKLFRDRSGIKPLYYYYDGKRFAFASELKALVKCCKDVEWSIDYTAIYDYLFYQYIPEPKTMYINCYKIPPAHMMEFDVASSKILGIKKYWKLHVNANIDSKRKGADICEELRELIKESVAEQMVADVPVGVFLSGGIDSSIITYECSRINSNIKTFIMGFDETKYNEKPFADIMINRYQLNCSSKIMQSRDFIEIEENIHDWFDEPFADTSAYPSFLVSELARKDVTVVLTGDGGDELFGGYDRYRLFATEILDKKIDNYNLSKIGYNLRLDRLVDKKIYNQYIAESLSLYNPLIFMADSNSVLDIKKKWKIDKNYDPLWHLRKFYHKELPPMTRMRYLDFKTYLPGDILTKVDRVSMANSLESRVPFLSRKIIEFAFSLPQDSVCEISNLKKILKDTYRDLIPDEILYRKKKGFSVPRSYLISNRRQRPVTVEVLNSRWKDV